MSDIRLRSNTRVRSDTRSGHTRLTLRLVAACLASGCRTGGSATGPRVTYTVAPDTPAQQAARVAARPPCAPIPAAPASWPVVPVTAVPGTIRLPSHLAASPAEVPTSAEQSWDDPTHGNVTLQRHDDAGLSSGLMITPDFTPGTTFIDEGACAQSFDGRLSLLRRTFWLNAKRPSDTVFVATTDIPLNGDVQLGAGVIASTRAGRETLLSALASLRLQAR